MRESNLDFNGFQLSAFNAAYERRDKQLYSLLFVKINIFVVYISFFKRFHFHLDQNKGFRTRRFSYFIL